MPGKDWAQEVRCGWLEKAEIDTNPGPCGVQFCRTNRELRRGTLDHCKLKGNNYLLEEHHHQSKNKTNKFHFYLIRSV